MNSKNINRTLIEDYALKISELAKHGTCIDGIAYSLFSSIEESAKGILEEMKSHRDFNKPTNKDTSNDQ